MARRAPPRLDLSGLLLLDKPLGISSNQALQHSRRALNADKAGHTGTLDLMASGLLAICLGEATKLCGYLLDAPKTYRADVALGSATSTGDREGEVIERGVCPALTRTEVATVCARFLGRSLQVPPMYSALKHAGLPLYTLARAGQEIEREPREIDITRLDVIAVEAERLVLEIACSKGTYIRTLVEDIGRALGCPAHLYDLRRLSVADFHIDQAWTAEGLMAAAREGKAAHCLLPADAIVAHYPAVHLAASDADRVLHGQPAADALVPDTPEPIRLYAPEDVFLGLGERRPDGRLWPKRLFRF